MTDPSIASEMETRSMNSVDTTTVSSYETPLDLKKAGEGRGSISPLSRSPAKDAGSPSPPKLQKGPNGISYSGTLQSETSKDTPEDLSVSKDDDDDDDGDDDSEKANETTPAGVDPERLKSFNMFVRLFVDENLDRIVPISKQPKEKIQAIIEACYRQFPEFHERARKRIRTYLKSCRRMKRQRDQNGIDSSTIRPTPPHLTSARAEQILAAACESESENARRMRMELVQQQQQQQLQQHTQQPQTVPVQVSGGCLGVSQAESQPDSRTAVTTQATPQPRPYEDSIPKQSPRATVGYHFENGVGGSHDPYFVPTQHQASVQPTVQHTPITNGPTDLSVKKLSSSKAQLSPTEIANIRQLITSYRESAAFLYRSADELEQMLLQLN
ncbi:Nucleolar protein 4-like [Holothuria leucospilota]|uniref:Nucleolar protein 4-like n=1 Tax=Holothuria leucospilota TaxID=206669 RepID=A0A9Q1H5E6_HOLLE|nr:Nucleolar protein 4-like [Holothuria leucospilota]